MLKELKFVQGAIARKDFVQALMHFRIKDKTIKGFNGMIGLCSPIALDLDVTPKADQFAKAIQTCKDTIALHVTPKGKLSIKSGQFKAMIECIAPGEYPEILPEGEFVKLEGSILSAIKALAPFIADDASRPWARGVLFRGQSAYATNNIVLVESWLGSPFPLHVNIPKEAINELLRINEEPERVQISANRVTFHFSDDRWLCTQTLSTEWPHLEKVLDNPSNAQPLPAGLFQAVEELAPFTDKMERVFLHADGKVSTSILDSEEGATIELDTVTFEGCYNYKHLLSIQDIATEMDFSLWPGPCLFFGDRVRGALIGMRK